MEFGKTNKRWMAGAVLLLLGCLTISLWPSKQYSELNLPETVDFNYHIRPILSQNCFTCHGPDSSSREAGLRLDQFEGATAMLEKGGFAIVPGDAEASLLISRISSEISEERMPPPEAKKTLSSREIALLSKWIDQGAEWKDHWSYIPPKKPKLPKGLETASISTGIDHFIDKEIQAHQLIPSEKASKNSLIRRVSYLLTGLPPAPEDVKAFIQDSSEQALSILIDKYLASPHFGERWARHWMDLVRYGEHMGHEFDFPISGAYQYRDYLIRAFNEDVPYDLFVKEHLAGDMLEKPRYHPTEGFNESVIGTGYFFLGEGKHSPVSIKEEEATRIDNMIDVTSKTFQAMTVACARCHDHKFDPIPTKDYYAMYGMIESARFGPVGARTGLAQAHSYEQLLDVQQKIRQELGKDWEMAYTEMTEESVFHLARFFEEKEKIKAKKVDKPKSKNAIGYQVLGDFRTGNWDGWYSDGFAFGEGPLMGEPVFDEETGKLLELQTGMASSRRFRKGLHGILRSPNFLVKHDSIAIRAAGMNGELRLIVDNFHLLQNPIYGGLNIVVEKEEMDTYYLDLSMVQGRKAYLQFTPGNYTRKTRHLYTLKPEDYIEVEYAVAFTGKLPDIEVATPMSSKKTSPADKKRVLTSWMSGKMTGQEYPALWELMEEVKDRPLPPELRDLLILQDSLSDVLYDSTHFIGLSEGDAVFSPVFIRGSHQTLSEEKVPRQFLSALKTVPKELPQTGSGRLAWAEAVIDPNNPLTSRVIVNRLWHHVFGRGIVETVDNFGLQGKLPTHPELLDYLALKIQEESWSMKTLLKQILLSEAFQRSTTAQPENATSDPNDLYLHHFPVRRLEGEAIRDGILTTSGCLDSTMYGEPIAIHLTPFMTGRGKPRVSGPLDGAGRRSIYMSVRRNFLQPMMLVFDAPIPFSTFGRRNTTNVPAQSLTLLNDPFVLDQANNWATNLLATNTGSTEDRITEIYLKAFSRKPQGDEIEKAIGFLEMQANSYESTLEQMQDDPKLWADFCHTIFNLKEFIHLL